MKQTLFLFSMLFACYESTQAQNDQPLFKPGTIYLGFSPGFFSSVKNSGWPDYFKYRTKVFNFTPSIGVFLTSGIQIGATGTYAARYSNYEDDSPIYGAGYYLRYYPRAKGFQRQIPLSARSKKKMNLSFFPMVELEHTVWNATFSRFEISPTQDRLYADELALKLGGTFRLGKNVFVSIQPTWYYHVESRQFSGLLPAGRTTFETYFNLGRPKEKFRFIEKKSPEEIAVIPERDTSRAHTLGNLIVGSSYTYIWDPAYEEFATGQTHLYEEFTWAFNVATDLSKRVRVGIDHKSLFTRSAFSGKNHYSMTGAFTQYNLLPRRRTRLFLSAMLYNGDYCSCDPDDPYLKENLWYYGLGWGIDLKLSRRLYLDLAWENMNILNNVHGKYNYTQYIIGLDYYLWKKKVV